MMEPSETAALTESGAPAAREAGGIRWLRVVIAGVAAEIALMIVALPALLLPDPQWALNNGIPPASFVAFVLFGYWAARPLKRLQPLNGLLAGAVAVLFYIGMTLAAYAAPGAPDSGFSSTLSPPYLLAHALKLLGGWTGGLLAARAGRPAP